VRSLAIDPYITEFHDEAFTQCSVRLTDACPCPLDYLLTLGSSSD
jgi:hypothetical protein